MAMSTRPNAVSRERSRASRRSTLASFVRSGASAIRLEIANSYDSLLEGAGFEPVWGFSCQVVFWVVVSSLFGAGKPFFVPSPAIRFAERAEEVKGPKR